MEPCKEIEIELPPFFRVYKDGTVERYRPIGFIPSGHHPEAGITSKDVIISPETGVSVRLYLPDSLPNGKLPILVYVHGGGFSIGSAFSSHHPYATSLVAEARVVGVSVEYRLAPEHPVPAGHYDSWTALQWVVRQAEAGPEAEPWLAEHGDFHRLFLAGESAGANHAHHMAMAASGVPAFGTLPAGSLPVRFVGLVLVHPAFSEPEAKLEDEPLWRVVCPTTKFPDDPIVNFMAPSAPEIDRLACGRVLVCVAEKDKMRNAGRLYYEVLVRRGWRGAAEIVETEGEKHVFHFFDPNSNKAKHLMEKIVSFINQS